MSHLTLKPITAELVGLHWANLTKAEYAIACILITAGLLFVDQFYTLQRKLS